VASSFQSIIDQSPLELKRYAAEIQRLEKTLAELKLDLASLESYHFEQISVKMANLQQRS
jgi:hypothetical protein